MSSTSPDLLQELTRFLDMLPAIARAARESPEIDQLLGQLLDELADRDLTEKHGYLTREQACGRICDVFQERNLPLTKALKHCGNSYRYHVLQTYVRCPKCGLVHKTRGYGSHDEFEDVAYLALYWLGVDPRSLKGWNPECERLPTPTAASDKESRGVPDYRTDESGDKQ
jgi:hypothetical protein